ncbi:hypothetical protein [Priestia aryabhattai]
MSLPKQSSNDTRKREAELIKYIRQEKNPKNITEALDELHKLAELGDRQTE